MSVDSNHIRYCGSFLWTVKDYKIMVFRWILTSQALKWFPQFYDNTFVCYCQIVKFLILIIYVSIWSVLCLFCNNQPSVIFYLSHVYVCTVVFCPYTAPRQRVICISIICFRLSCNFACPLFSFQILNEKVIIYTLIGYLYFCLYIY